MIEPLGDTWMRRDLPVLREVALGLEQTFGQPFMARQLSVDGLDADDVIRALVALNGTYIDARQSFVSGGSGPSTRVQVCGLTERGRRTVGLWPELADDSFDRLVRALQVQIESTDDEQERGRLRKVMESVRGLGKDVTVRVLTNVLTGEITG